MGLTLCKAARDVNFIAPAKLIRPISSKIICLPSASSTISNVLARAARLSSIS